MKSPQPDSKKESKKKLTQLKYLHIGYLYVLGANTTRIAKFSHHFNTAEIYLLIRNLIKEHNIANIKPLLVANYPDLCSVTKLKT